MYDDQTLQRYTEKRQIAAQIVKLSTETATVIAAAQALDVTPDQIIKSLLFLVAGDPILVIANGTARVSPKKIAQHLGVGKRKVRMARPDEVEAIAGFGVGAMPPFGHKEPLPTLIDPGVIEQSEIYGGGGTVQTMLRLTPRTLLEVTRGEIVSVTERKREQPHA
ncbi:MAG: YbaK/EbsC family protein [Chloroflexi bacterium]|nr:YbaK/EbsC family protein [Chloroflexota bacterium]